MSIPLVQEATKDAINTSIIAIKRNIERINMLLGLSNSEEIDTSKFATKEELQQAVTDLQPVDEVALNNMHSVTSNAVAKQLEVRIVNGGTNGGAYFVDENGNEILVADYSVGAISWPNSQGYSGFIMMPYYPSDGIGRWAVWNIFQNNWVINVTGLKAIFRK